MKRVIIYRGLPGSGKSTEAKKHKKGWVVSADHYFMVDGVYRFDASKLGDAHIACMYNFLALINLYTPLIIVDNTNTRLMELNPYRLVALASGYKVEVVRMQCDPIICAQRNTHGVPEAAIMKMWQNFENLPAFMGAERVVNG